MMLARTCYKETMEFLNRYRMVGMEAFPRCRETTEFVTKDKMMLARTWYKEFLNMDKMLLMVS